MPGVALHDIHTLLAQDTARVHRESSNATESLLRVLDDPPAPGTNPPPPPPSQQHPQHTPHPGHPHLGPPNLNPYHNGTMAPSPTSVNGAAPKNRLTNAQKKLNHIESEKKRREAIRLGFDKLSTIVPKMEGQGRSEAVVIQHTVEYLRYLLAKRDALNEMAAKKGIPPTERQGIYLAAEQEIRKKNEALMLAQEQAHQDAQNAARQDAQNAARQDAQNAARQQQQQQQMEGPPR